MNGLGDRNGPRAEGLARTPGGNPPAALDGIRVIDLATPRAELAGRVLADLGAEVLKLEPPEGAGARRLPPFEAGREGDPEGSLYWASVGLGKRSALLDLFAPGGSESLRALLAEADVLIESFDPGSLDDVGLGAAQVCADFPRLVYASVTPFGQTGPLAGAPAADLTLEAAGGLLGLQGDPDRPPIGAGLPQASFHAGVQAAADILVALNERERSGLGQHLDVSAQAAVVWTLMNASGFPTAAGHDPPGTGESRGDAPPELLPGLPLPNRARCADGFTQVGLGLPGLGERTLHALMGWVERSGELDPDLRGLDWSRFIRDGVEGRLKIEQLRRAVEAACAFLERRSLREIQSFATEERVMLAPIYDMAALRNDPQLGARGYWNRLGGRSHPGPFAILPEAPLRMDRPAPALGEAQSLLERAGRDGADRSGSTARAAPEVNAAVPVAPGGPPGAFAGLKVADFAWSAAGPILGKALADHGATVVHVESSTRPDITRLAPPFLNDEPHLDRAHMFANFNTSKRGIALDLSKPAARQVARRLCDWADVVVESFTPGTMQRFGLDWPRLSAGRRDLILLSTSLRGQTGPERRYTGFGSQGAALAGFDSVTGWPDRIPTGPWGAYTDFISTRYGLAALAASLLFRTRTGRGQWIDLSQVEAAIHFVEPLLLDYVRNGRVAGAQGQASAHACPHGTYATRGRERYLALAVETAAQWEALRGLAPLEDFSAAELSALDARIARREAIEARLRDWCREQDAFELAERLRGAGVPAYAVLRPSDLQTDPQLAHRGFFVTLDHPAMGSVTCDGPATHFSRTPARPRSAAPTLGQHSQEILRDILGLSDAEISELALAGALS